jgi:Na+/melibiose symporter-like transporter
LSQIRLVKDVPYTGPRQIDFVGAVLSVIGMGGVVLGILVWQEGGQYVGLLMGIGVVALAAFAFWLVRRKRGGKPTLLDPDLFKHLNFRIGVSQQMFQQITLGGAMIALPLFLQMTLEYNAMQTGLTLAPLSLSMFGMAILAGRKAGKRRPANIVLAGFTLSTVGMAAIIPLVPRVDSGWYLLIPLVITGAGLGLLVSQLNNFTLAPISEERVSEAAGVNSAAGSFGLSFGLAMAGGIMLWALALSFTHLTDTSTAIPPAQQQQISTYLEHDAEVMSNTQLQKQIADQPQDVQDAVLAINTDARNRSLQVALCVPAIASLLGVANSFRMRRLPDITPKADIEGVDFG